jgi:nucleotide-binding universal stress UspA family protein
MSGSSPIVVGVDGSADGAGALAWAAEAAAALDAEVVAVHALGLLSHVGGTAAPAQSHRSEIEALLAGAWTEVLRRRAVRHRCEVHDGNPVTALLASAREHGAAMVVVGRRGSGGFAGLQLGSTSQQLAQHASLPVVIVPPEDGGAA